MFLFTSSERMRGNGHKLKYGKNHFSKEKKVLWGSNTGIAREPGNISMTGDSPAELALVGTAFSWELGVDNFQRCLLTSAILCIIAVQYF